MPDVFTRPGYVKIFTVNPPMHITLEPIRPEEDYADAAYASEDCRLALDMWAEYYPKIGFQPPWIGYLVKLDHQVAGTCAFTGPPDRAAWKFRTGLLRRLKAGELPHTRAGHYSNWPETPTPP